MSELRVERVGTAGEAKLADYAEAKGRERSARNRVGDTHTRGRLRRIADDTVSFLRVQLYSPEVNKRVWGTIK